MRISDPGRGVRAIRRLTAAGALAVLPVLAVAQAPASPVAAPPATSARAMALPAVVDAALQRAKIPREAVSFYVAEAEGRSSPRLAWREREAMNPASVMKLVTTYAALDLLGPAYVWRTPVYLDGSISNGSLQGHLYLQGRGDPKLVMERL